MDALKIFGIIDAYGYNLLLQKKIPWAFVPIDPLNVSTKFEVRSFTHS